jgi:hypothetical protein
MAMDMLPSEAELLDRQHALQMEAEHVARDIKLMELAQPSAIRFPSAAPPSVSWSGAILT